MAEQLRPSPFVKTNPFSEGLLAGIFSRGDAAKRKLRDAAGNPRQFLTGLLAGSPPEQRTSEAEKVNALLSAMRGSVMPGVTDLERNALYDSSQEEFGGMNSGALGMIKFGPREAKQFVKWAKTEGQPGKKWQGASLNMETGEGMARGDPVPKGYMVANRGPMKKKFESIAPDIDERRVLEYFRQHGDELSKPGAFLGAWPDNGSWYMDVSGNIPTRKAAADATINRGERAAFRVPPSNRSGLVDDPFPSFPVDRKYRAQDTNVRKRSAMEDALAKGLDTEAERLTQLARNEPRVKVPDDPEYWPWRIEKGGFDLKYNPRPDAFDPGPGHYSVNKVQSADEVRLAEKVKEAEKLLEKGKLKPLFTEKDLKRQPYRGFTLDVPYPKKAMPQWLQDNLTDPKVKQSWLDATNAGLLKDPNAPKWYYTGKMHDDLLQLTGGDVFKTEAAMDRYGNYMGTNTASSTPPQNTRTASFHNLRNNQGLPVPETVQYPYGHVKYGTHARAMRELERLGHIDPQANPKGAHFAGNLSGLTDDPTIDKVVSNNLPLLNASGKKLDAPEYYGPVRDTMNQWTNEFGMTGEAGQATPWVAWNPKGGKPALMHLGDRIAVTSHVTGIPQKKLYTTFLRQLLGSKKGSPLLSTGLLAPGLIPDDE